MRREALPAGVDTMVTYLAMVSDKGSVASAQMTCSRITHFNRKKFPGSPLPMENLMDQVKQLITAIRRRHWTAVVVRALL